MTVRSSSDPARAGVSVQDLPSVEPLAVGDLAPDFVLNDQYGAEVDLATMLEDGAHVLVVFFPFAFSGICTGELAEIQLDIDAFSNERVQVVGVSCDPTYSLKTWAAYEGYRFPLLSDFWPHGEVAQAYGVFDADRGMAVRGTYLVAPDGTIAWALVNGPGEQRPIGALHGAIRAIPATT